MHAKMCHTRRPQPQRSRFVRYNANQSNTVLRTDSRRQGSSVLEVFACLLACFGNIAVGMGNKLGVFACTRSYTNPLYTPAHSVLQLYLLRMHLSAIAAWGRHQGRIADRSHAINVQWLQQPC